MTPPSKKGQPNFFPKVEDSRLVRFYANCTPKQKRVIELVTGGLDNYHVGLIMKIKDKSVADHLTKIYGSLSALEELEFNYPDRWMLIRLFADFFELHPELRNNFSDPQV